jgi:hypothetical protein
MAKTRRVPPARKGMARPRKRPSAAEVRAAKARSDAAKRAAVTRGKNARARERARKAEHEKRSAAAREGWRRRIVRDNLAPILARFVSARKTEGPREIREAYDKWAAARDVFRDRPGWRSILDAIGDELNLDDDFIEALDESPDEGTS